VFVQFGDWGRDIAIAASEAREHRRDPRPVPDDFQRYFVRRWSTGGQEAMLRA
jgi:HAE1 family hydrophobic/amphiphilic exporter-1